jgi:anti-sigma B factor antagonist
MPELDIAFDREGRTQVLSVRGELDLDSAPKLEAAFARLEADPPERLLIDLGECEFIDSGGLAVLFHGARSLHGEKGSVRIACPEGNLRELLRITAIDQTIPVVATRREALAALGLEEGGAAEP